ncbi:MAG: hypothetical protein AAF993_10385 [Pseudomonadota bacterium]
MAVLATLRTMICMGVAVLVWFVLVLTLRVPDSLLGALLPVWAGGLAGGVVSCIFSTRQGMTMAFTSGVLLMCGFLWYRHVVADIGLGENTVITLWPLWFPAAFYVGAYAYLTILASRSGK